MLKVVLDTNVLLSALVFGGVPQQVVIKCIDSKDIQIYLSKQIWDEINQKFLGEKIMEIAKKSKRNLEKYKIVEFLQLLDVNSLCVEITQNFDLCRDPKDNMFLDVAFACSANYIISGDKDLLSLQNFEKTAIVLPSVFISLY